MGGRTALGHMEEAYRTIDGRAVAEIVEKKSRFIGSLAHVESEEEALAFIEEIKAANRMARHNVYAYRLRDGRERYSDDGEPAKTAGMPTLEVLRHTELTDVAIVTTRYFGGVLLGTGGLVRAYTAAAQEAVAASTVLTVSRCTDLHFSVEYPLYEATARLAQDCGAQVREAQFGVNVCMQLRMLAGTEEAFLRGMSELSRGSVNIDVSEPFDAVFDAS